MCLKLLFEKTLFFQLCNHQYLLLFSLVQNHTQSYSVKYFNKYKVLEMIFTEAEYVEKKTSTQHYNHDPSLYTGIYYIPTAIILGLTHDLIRRKCFQNNKKCIYTPLGQTDTNTQNKSKLPEFLHSYFILKHEIQSHSEIQSSIHSWHNVM